MMIPSPTASVSTFKWLAGLLACLHSPVVGREAAGQLEAGLGPAKVVHLPHSTCSKGRKQDLGWR